jgi:hypothetical protein
VEQDGRESSPRRLYTTGMRALGRARGVWTVIKLAGGKRANGLSLRYEPPTVYNGECVLMF